MRAVQPNKALKLTRHGSNGASQLSAVLDGRRNRVAGIAGAGFARTLVRLGDVSMRIGM
jgi:hypothetical protein